MAKAISSARNAMQIIECVYALYRKFAQHRLHGYGVKAFHNFESDFLSVTQAGLTHEIEIKMSRSDFLADFKKQNKHALIQHGELANFFWFAAPKGMLKAQDIPDYAGHIEFEYETIQVGRNTLVQYRMNAYIVKDAPRIHRNKKKVDEKIFRSMYYKQLNTLREKVSHIEKERYANGKRSKGAL